MILTGLLGRKNKTCPFDQKPGRRLSFDHSSLVSDSWMEWHPSMNMFNCNGGKKKKTHAVVDVEPRYKTSFSISSNSGVSYGCLHCFHVAWKGEFEILEIWLVPVNKLKTNKRLSFNNTGQPQVDGQLSSDAVKEKNTRGLHMDAQHCAKNWLGVTNYCPTCRPCAVPSSSQLDSSTTLPLASTRTTKTYMNVLFLLCLTCKKCKKNFRFLVCLW